MQPGQFSFLGDEFENLFNYSDLFLPGIEKITGIFYSPAEKKLKALSRKRDEHVESDFRDMLDDQESRIMIQKFRADGKNVLWTKKEELPFEIPEKIKSVAAPNIFSELENVILVLRFPNEADSLYDMLIIYFNQNFGNFGISRSDKLLTSQNKSIIGHLLYHQFKSLLLMNHQNMSLLKKFNQGVMSVIRANASLKDQLRQVQMNYGESMVNLAQQILSDVSGRQDRNYSFTQEALDKIRDFQGNVRHLQAIIQNAVIFTENLMIHSGEDVIKIHDFSLDFDSYQVQSETDQVTRRIDSRQSKAMLLLDKLEKASASLKSRSIPLTGANVGKNFTPPISPPAITDALAKNKTYIRQLLLRHPEKWEIIRKEFKPLLNILKDDSLDTAQEVSA
jgi:hypothetical protein